MIARFAVNFSFVVIYTLAGMLPLSTAAQETPAGEDANGVYRLEFQSGNYISKNASDARDVVKDMIATKGADATLTSSGLHDLRLKVAFAEHYLANGNEAEYQSIRNEIDRSAGRLGARQHELRQLFNRLRNEQDSEKARFDELVGTNDSLDEFLKEVFDGRTSRYLSQILTSLGKEKSGMLLRGASRALGAISVAKDVYRAFAEFDEYSEARHMLADLMERQELLAFLAVLIAKYDKTLDIYDALMAELDLAKRKRCP